MTVVQLEVSRSFTTWTTGSWLQPCGPATRTSRSRPTAGSWGHRNQKFITRNRSVQNTFGSCFSASEKLVFVKTSGENMCFSKKVHFLNSCVFDFWEVASCAIPLLRFLSFLSAEEIHSGPSLHDLLSETCQRSSVFSYSGNCSCHEIRSSRTRKTLLL